jgi:purine nucleoside permease
MSKGINAGLTIFALTSSTAVDLSKAYFMLSRIPGVNPKIATVGVSFEN